MPIEEISKRLAEIRKDAGLSQDDFADIVGVSQAHISDLESGRRKPPPPLRTAICYKFAINEKWLEHGYGEKYSEKGVDNDVPKKVVYKTSETDSEASVAKITVPLKEYNELVVGKADADREVERLKKEIEQLSKETG